MIGRIDSHTEGSMVKIGFRRIGNCELRKPYGEAFDAIASPMVGSELKDLSPTSPVFLVVTVLFVVIAGRTNPVGLVNKILVIVRVALSRGYFSIRKHHNTLAKHTSSLTRKRSC